MGLEIGQKLFAIDDYYIDESKCITKFNTYEVVKLWDYDGFYVIDDENDKHLFKKRDIGTIFQLTKEPTSLIEKAFPEHYDNSKGSIYQFCENQKLNSYEFDIIKRVVRCRKKGQFKEDLEKTKVLIDLYLKEQENK